VAASAGAEGGEQSPASYHAVNELGSHLNIRHLDGENVECLDVTPIIALFTANQFKCLSMNNLRSRTGFSHQTKSNQIKVLFH
jgi:hypothetical protein